MSTHPFSQEYKAGAVAAQSLPTQKLKFKSIHSESGRNGGTALIAFRCMSKTSLSALIFSTMKFLCIVGKCSTPRFNRRFKNAWYAFSRCLHYYSLAYHIGVAVWPVQQPFRSLAQNSNQNLYYTKKSASLADLKNSTFAHMHISRSRRPIK